MLQKEKINSIPVVSFVKKDLVKGLISIVLLLPFTLIGLKAIGQNNVPSQQTEIVINGKVTDSTGDPLPGASVMDVQSGKGTTSDKNGAFSIHARAGNEIQVKSIGYITQRFTVSELKKTVTIVLKQAETSLNQYVVIGYGSQKKKDVTGSTVSLSSDIMENRQVLSVTDAMKGKASGVNIRSTDGTPGSQNSIIIRGATSISSDSGPLYVIDGFPSTTLTVSPSEIETIDILKDAASTAIYGTRGANGVVIITTKKGEKNKLKLNVYGLAGVQSPEKKLDLMDSYDFARKNYEFQMFFVKASDFNINNYDPNAYFWYVDNGGNIYATNKTNTYQNFNKYLQNNDTTYHTNWQNAMMQNALMQDYRVTLTGGGDKTNYAFVGSYLNQDGIMINTNTKQYTFNGNIDIHVTDKLKLSYMGNLIRTTTTGFSSNALSGLNGVLFETLIQAPIKPVDFDLSYPPLEGENLNGQLINPVKMSQDITNNQVTNNMLNNVSLDYRINDYWDVTVRGGYNLTTTNTDQYFPSDIVGGIGYGGRALETNYKQELLSNEDLLTFSHPIKNSGNYQVLLGTSVYQTVNSQLTTENRNFALEGLGFGGIGLGTNPQPPSYSYQKIDLASAFSRFNMDYLGKYLFKATLRTDGSSRFAQNNKWGFFPSAALGWIVSDENFLKNSAVISFMKLRASWGISGKEAISPYSSLATIGTRMSSVDGVTNSLVSYYSSLANPNLQWEKTGEFDLGLDMNFFKDKLTLSADVYQRKTTDLLFNEPIPTYTGFSNFTHNVGSIENKGFEVSLSGNTVNLGNVIWSSNFNISINKSKVLKFGLQDYQILSASSTTLGNQHGIIQVGDPLGNWYGYKTDGIWQSQEEIDAARSAGKLANSYQVLPGDRKIIDQNGDGLITSADREKIGNGLPKFYGGFTNSFSYKGFTLNFSFQYSLGNDIYNTTRYYLEEGNNYDNQLNEQRWQPELYNYNPVTKEKGTLFQKGNNSNSVPIARYGKIQDNTPLDVYIENGSFIRLADVTFSYALPASLLKPLRMSALSVFVTGRNLKTWTNYSGYDPEVNNSTGSASYLLPGLDNFAYPIAKSFSGGLNITF